MAGPKKILFNSYTGAGSFESSYLEARQKENRIYSDEIVARLPDVPSTSKYHTEWVKRTNSLNRLIKYISAKQRPLRILEVGCGNGWLSNRLAQINNTRVLASDINLAELSQGARVFASTAQLEFIYSNLPSIATDNEKFDLLIFAASLQYFNSIETLLPLCKSLLNQNGEVHIIDTPLYKKEQLAAAKARTTEYYGKLGFPEMAKFYFHHCKDDFDKLGFEVLYTPSGFMRVFHRSASPFYWLRYTPKQ